MALSLGLRALLEALGTAVLAFSIAKAGHGDLSGFEQAWVIGLTLCLLIHLLGRLSGAHFNPGVTLMLNQQRFGWRGLTAGAGLRETLVYVVAQLVGALLGFRLDPLASPGEPMLMTGFIPELAFTLGLYGLILVWSREGKICPFAQPLAGVVIGAGLVVLVILGGLTGSGIYNPAIGLGLISVGKVGVVPLIGAQLLAAVLLSALNPRAQRVI